MWSNGRVKKSCFMEVESVRKDIKIYNTMKNK